MTSSSSDRRMKIGDFLLRRLEEVGVRHLFGVPGDYAISSGSCRSRRSASGPVGGRAEGGKTKADSRTRQRVAI